MTPVDKICVLGGSSINTPELLLALRAELLLVGEIALVGRSADKLDIVRRFCERRAGELGMTTGVSATTDIDSGLENASFVINMIRVGGSEVWGRCMHIMQAYGLDGQALYHAGAISNLSTVLEYAESVRRVCPDAWLIEFTNPCGLHVAAMTEHAPGLRAISGCNVPIATRARIAELLDLVASPPDTRHAGTSVGGVEIHWFGFNHCAWITDVTVDGTSVLDKVVERNAALDQPLWDVSQIERLGAIAVGAAADLLRAAHENRRPPDDAAQRASAYRDGGDREAVLLKRYADETVPTEQALVEKGRFGSYESAIVPIVAGLAREEPRRYFSAWPTVEALPGFPGSHVECALTLAGGAATPAFAPQPLPPELNALCQRAHESEQLVVEAAVSRSRAKFVEALAAHPTCGSVAYATAVVDALLRQVDLPIR